MESLQLWNLGGCLLLPWPGRLAGMEEAVDLRRTKGLRGLAAVRTSPTCCVTVPQLSAQLSTSARFTFQCLRPVSSAFLTSLFFPPILSLHLHQSSTWDLPSGYWGVISPKKRLNQGFAELSPPPEAWTWFLVPERGCLFLPLFTGL